MAIQVRGFVNLDLYGADGALKDSRRRENLVVEDGEEHIIDLLVNKAAVTAMTGMRLGTDGTAPATGDSDLGADINGSGKAFDATYPKEGSTTQRIDYQTTWDPGEATNGAIREAGIFNDVSDAYTGTMLARTTFGAINKLAADTLRVTWTIEIGACP